MDEFVNKIKTKDGSEYEIRDARMPEVPSGGTKLYKHYFTLNGGSRQISIYADKNTSFYIGNAMGVYKLIVPEDINIINIQIEGGFASCYLGTSAGLRTLSLAYNSTDITFSEGDTITDTVTEL